ncbi:MAG: type III-B CRISPR module RAMP protein Cmr6 [Candidatus Polarisedimenticolaceae bacterium]|nr:type III-B CRISPR module RAMP protein Cmr6 [Candidatus Polarisedimenticolaceae bacterium]
MNQMGRNHIAKDKSHLCFENASLLFDKGFKKWASDSAERGVAIGQHIDDVCNISVPEIYKLAYHRWLGTTLNDDRFAKWYGQLEGRLFIGLGGAHVLEAQVTRHPTYGIPIIPGSALKGLVRAKSQEYGLQKEEADILFGKGGDSPDEADAGYLLFHDAWWIPEGGSKPTPYVRDIVTVHAKEYYATQGGDCPHPDMESPNPNHQLAVQGSFYFVIEGVKYWADLAMKILKPALQDEGIGGKVAAGYGYFSDDTEAEKTGNSRARKSHAAYADRCNTYKAQYKQKQEDIIISTLSPAEKLTRQLKNTIERYEKIKCDRNLNPQEKAEISAAINNILKPKEIIVWTAEQRSDAADYINTANKAFFNTKERKRRQEKVNAFLEAYSSEG